MREVSFVQLFWRVVLAISLVAGPAVPVTAAASSDPVAHAATPAGAMPCHGDAAPAPTPEPAKKAPCDDGCCPQPDCDPGLCRVAGSLNTGFVPFVAAPAPQAHVLAWVTLAPPDVALPPLLRPPIA